MFRVGTKFVEDADAVGPRCGFDVSGEDELEERFVTAHVEAKPVKGIEDRVDEQT